MKFAYKAVGADGKINEGVIDAADQAQLVKFLRGRHMVPVSINATQPEIFSRFSHLWGHVSGKDVVFLTRQLSSMLASGLNLVQALSILRNQTQKPALREVVEHLLSAIEEGNTFAIALERYPKVFTPIYIALVRAAESSGLLDKILLRLADNLEKQQKLKGTIRSALVYPAIIVFLMIIVFFLMVIVVIPQLSSLYKSLNTSIPASMSIMLGISSVVTNYWYIVMVGIVGLVYGYRKWYTTQVGRLTIDTVVLKSPVFGKLLAQSTLAEFSRTFGLLVNAGTPIVEALNQSANVISNVVYQNAIKQVGKRVEKGVSIGDAMGSFPIFPPILVEMVKIGDQTGKVDESLSRVSEYFEREVDQMVKTLTTLLEPLIMIVLAIGVGFLIYAVITPIYRLMNAIQ